MSGRRLGRSGQFERSDPANRGDKAARSGQQERERLQAKVGESIKRAEATARLEAIAQTIAEPLGLEVVEVEWKGSGRNQLLRVYIDKATGVTHADCELVSHQMSAILDADDPVPGSYELEVSSPGVERKLKKVGDWQRFTGQKAKVVLKEPIDSDPAEAKYFDGTIVGVEDPDGEPQITVETAHGRKFRFPFAQVDRANLKFEW